MSMASTRKGVLSLSIIAILILASQIPIASNLTPVLEPYQSSGTTPLAINVVADSDVGGSEVAVDIEFSNLTAYDLYNYEIWFTRVDHNFSHHTITGNFTAYSTGHNLSKSWSPDQDGPYTVHCNLSKDGHFLLSNNNRFEWGDVANNSELPYTLISFEYEGDGEYDDGTEVVDDWYYLDLFENDSLQENTTINFDSGDTETGASYLMTFAVYKLAAPDDIRLLGMSTAMFHSSYTMATLNHSIEGGWVEGSDYQFTLELKLNSDGMSPVAYDTLNFTIDTPPIPIIRGCTDFNASNYDSNASEDDGTCEYEDTDGDGIYDYLEILGCTDYNATNYDSNATDDNGSCEYKDSDQDGVFDHLEIKGCTDYNATNYNSNATDDNGSCEYKDSDLDGVFDHLEVIGCTDRDALNWNVIATDEGTCDYRVLELELNANQTTGYEPLEVSFTAEITGGNAPYEILWNFGDGETSNQGVVNHIFSAGVYMVVLKVTDDNEEVVQRTLPIIVSENIETEELSGYFTHSGQLEPMTEGMFTTLQFTGIASGGQSPYTFTWHFGDDTMGGESTVIHEYAEMGQYSVQLTIEDSAGRTVQITDTVNITKFDEGVSGGTSSTEEDDEGGDLNFELYASGAGVIGLLLIFGLFGRKRRDSFLDQERRKMQGEKSIWDDY